MITTQIIIIILLTITLIFLFNYTYKLFSEIQILKSNEELLKDRIDSLKQLRIMDSEQHLKELERLANMIADLREKLGKTPKKTKKFKKNK